MKETEISDNNGGAHDVFDLGVRIGAYRERTLSFRPRGSLLENTAPDRRTKKIGLRLLGKLGKLLKTRPSAAPKDSPPPPLLRLDQSPFAIYLFCS